ncbi:MAG TPA: hypothetical protein VI384_04480 [Candidatus Dormibacteraeota bacterium]
MADFDIDSVIAQHAAPKGKRAAAAPAATPADDTFDIDAAIASAPTDAGPTARRVASGKPPEPAVAPDDSTPLDLRDVERQRQIEAHKARTRAEDPLANDPLALAITGGMVAAPLAATAGAGAAALGAGPVLQGLTTGAVGGAVSTAATGGSPKSIALGAALGGGLGALPPLLQGAARRVSERTFQEVASAARGAGKAKTLAKLEGIGPDETADVIKRYEIPDLKNGAAARAANQAAIQQAGQKMGNALDVISAAPEGRIPLGDAMAKLESLRKELLANETTRPMADQLYKYMRNFWEVNGGKKDALISAADLHGKVSDLQSVGYAGAGTELSPASAKVLARQTAGALDEILDERIAAAAKANPAAAGAAKELEAATKDYRVLKTLEPITKAQAIAQRFAPSAAQRFTDAMSHPVRSAAKVAIAPMVRAPAAAAAAVDRMIARLYTAPAITSPLIQEAVDSGVAPSTIAAIASMRKARAQPLAPAPVTP